MKTYTLKTAVLLMSFLFFRATTPLVFAAGEGQGEITLKEVKQETSQTCKSIENYTADQKDEAVKITQTALADIDSRIDKLENSFAAHWRSMSDASRKKEQEVLRELKRERIKVAEWYGGMKNSSAETWEDTKKAFLKSTDALSEAFNKAEKQLTPKQKSK